MSTIRVDTSSEQIASGDYRKSLYINGEFRGGIGGGTAAVLTPATGDVYQEVGYGGQQDADLALDAAAQAFGNWAAASVRQRADSLNRVAGLLRERREQIGRVLCHESGKRLAEAIAEVNFSAEYFQWFAEEIRRPMGSILSGDVASRRQWEIYEPRGVAGVLTPWNFPVSIQARKLAAALAAGCTVVSRPSEKTPCSVVELFRCLHDAGLPAGVANLVLGPPAEITERIFAHPSVRVVSFTGSTAVGKMLMRLAADRVVRLALELGGNAPFIVHHDADLDAAVKGAMVAKFRNNGQSCIAANRFLVHARRYEEFASKLAQRVGVLRAGDPMQENVDLGPLIDERSKERLEAAVAEAMEKGARQIHDDVKVPAVGAFVAPRILCDVSTDTFVGCEEIFGPVASLASYEDIDEVLSRANSPSVGLAGYVYTSDLNMATRMAESLRVGIVGLNNSLPAAAYSPMGGVKESGFGREGGEHGLRDFQDVKYVSIELG